MIGFAPVPAHVQQGVHTRRRILTSGSGADGIGYTFDYGAWGNEADPFLLVSGQVFALSQVVQIGTTFRIRALNLPDGVLNIGSIKRWANFTTEQGAGQASAFSVILLGTTAQWDWFNATSGLVNGETHQLLIET